MGDPRKIRKKYSKPLHPWSDERIEEEKVFVREYGIRRKKELYKASSLLRKFKKTAKKLVALRTKQAEIEKEQLILRLNRLGILSKEASFDNILDLTMRDILERRLQTLLVRKELARTMKQARQFVVHKHVVVGDKVVTVPSYLVKKDEEDKISFREKSSLFDPDHPERQLKEKKEKERLKKQQSEEESMPLLKEEEIIGEEDE